MKLALKTHRLPLVASALACIAVIGTVFGGATITLPGATGAVPVAFIAAVIASIVIAPPLVRAWPTTRTNPSRRPGLITAAALAAMLAPALCIAAAVGAAFDWGAAAAFVSDLFWLLGLQLITATCITATYQGVTVAVYGLLCALVGRIRGVVQPWAWPLADIAAPVVLAIGSASLAIGVMSLILIGMRDPR